MSTLPTSAVPTWIPRIQTTIRTSSHQELLYEAQDPTCEFHAHRWPADKLQGRDRHGEFVCAVARKHYEVDGFRVLFSNTSRVSRDTFILATFPGKRRGPNPDSAYSRTLDLFTPSAVDSLNAEADWLRTKYGFINKATGKPNAGGDPDLLVYNTRPGGDRFFVEVKRFGKDSVKDQQHLVFALIEKHLKVPVHLAWVHVE